MVFFPKKKQIFFLLSFLSKKLNQVQSKIKHRSNELDFGNESTVKGRPK